MFREEDVTVVSVLTTIGMTVSTIVLGIVNSVKSVVAPKPSPHQHPDTEPPHPVPDPDPEPPHPEPEP